MSRIMWYILFSLLLLVTFTCSNDVEMPDQYHVNYLAQPTNVEATVDVQGLVHVSWQIASTANVESFVVSFTDSLGAVETRLVADPEATTYVDSTLGSNHGSIYFVQVWAVDNHAFTGPPSIPDTLLVP